MGTTEVKCVKTQDGWCYEHLSFSCPTPGGIVPTHRPILPIHDRKLMPIVRGLLDYFPLACAAVANASYVATQQHHPGEEMHWDREKSKDHADCLARHLIERGTIDSDGVRHSAKVAWRALALLQLELEEAHKNGR